MIELGKIVPGGVSALMQKALSVSIGWLGMVIGIALWSGSVFAFEEPQTDAAADRASFDGSIWSALRYVPRDAYFVAGARPRDLLTASELDGQDEVLTALLEFGIGRRLDTKLLDVDQLVVVGAYGGVRLADYNVMAILNLRTRAATEHFMQLLFGSEFDSLGADGNGNGTVAVVRDLAGAFLGERTVLLGQPAVVQNWRFSASMPPALDITDCWRVQSATPADTYAFALLAKVDDWMLSENAWLSAASPLLRHTRRAEVVVQWHAGLRLQTTVTANQESLSDIEATLRAGTTILRNVLGELPPDLAAWSRQAATPALSLVRDVLRQPLVELNEESSSVRMTLAFERDQMRQLQAVIEPVAPELQLSARRALRSRNLQKIGVAMLAYYGKHGRFPASGIQSDDSAELHSWRVALLPFLGEQSLYERYQLDEPWNSASNQEVLRRMPDVYRHIDDSPTSYRSAYYGLTGPGTAFGDGREEVQLRDFRDG
ncbi:MAG: DUF1559 family PulG-like putative transporter, partial [Planctomycetota bacterium]